MNRNEMLSLCKRMRYDIVSMIGRAGSGHPGGSLSCVEILAALYGDVMKQNPENPLDPDRDRLVLSKGHAAPALYAVLGELGYFSKDNFESFRQYHSILQGHPDRNKCPGVDACTGSLGQGISIAVGMALAAKYDKSDVHIYAVIGDGESQEGQLWEASMAAAHYHLDNLTVIADHNGLQIDGSNDQVMSLGDYSAKFRAFGYDVIEVADGNDLDQVLAALHAAPAAGKPRLILCQTVKGKGVSFMENQVGWHGKAPSGDLLQQALKEIEEA